MKTILCKLFGHQWKYFFSPSDAYSKRMDIRTCKWCGKMQHYKQIPAFEFAEYIWMNMIGYTKKGAKAFWGELV